MNLAGALLLLLSLALLLLRQLAIQFRLGNMDKLGHEGLESTERGVWGGSGFSAGLHPRPLYPTAHFVRRFILSVLSSLRM